VTELKTDKIVFKPVVTFFYCINALGKTAAKILEQTSGAEVRLVRLPCSSMIKDAFLLRAFEAGADAVAIITCPEGRCQFIDGNKRAAKRVKRVQKMLDDIGLGAKRLSFFNAATQDEDTALMIAAQVLSAVKELGPNPAA